MTAVYVIRHPKTTWNAVQRYQGRLESTLHNDGTRQAERLLAALSRDRFDAVYSSPLRRARALADPLASLSGVTLIVDQRLTEMAQGPWEGLFLREIQAIYGDLHHNWYLRPDATTFPGGERLADVEVRALSALRALQGKHPTGNVAVVTHSVVIQVLAAKGLRLALNELHRLPVDNCGVTTICLDPQAIRLLNLNGTDSVQDSPLASAEAQNCVSWTGHATS